jgi:hypothetical protein
MMDKVQKPSNSECHTPSSESFRIYLYNWYGPSIFPSFRKLERLKIQLAKTLNHITFPSPHEMQISGYHPQGLLCKDPLL